MCDVNGMTRYRKEQLMRMENDDDWIKLVDTQAKEMQRVWSGNWGTSSALEEGGRIYVAL